jgi:2'-5' RNA ligase
LKLAVVSMASREERMSEVETKSLMEQRAELERQLEELKAKKSSGNYTPGMTIVTSETSETFDEQTELEIAELEAAIAEIDEELKDPAT